MLLPLISSLIIGPIVASAPYPSSQSTPSANASISVQRLDAVTVTQDSVIIESGGGVELLELIRAATEVSGRHFSYDEREIQGYKFNVTGRMEVTHDDYSAFFSSVLRELDFVAITLGNSVQDSGSFWSIRRVAPGAKPGYLKSAARIVLPEDLDKVAAEGTSTLVTTCFKLKNVDARSAATVLTPYFADQFVESVRNLEGANSLLCTGYVTTLVGIRSLIEQIDSPSEIAPSKAAMDALLNRISTLEASLKSLSDSGK